MSQNSKTEQIIANLDTMIRQHMEDIQIQIGIVKANQGGHLTLHKILVKDARTYIEMNREAIKTFIELKRKYELKLTN